MKNPINYLLILFLSIFASCSKSDDNSLPDDNHGGPLSNSYWPLAVGNTWNLANIDNSQEKSTYFLHKSIQHEGKTYYQFKPVGTDLEVEITDGIREDNGIFYELHGATSAMGVNTSPGVITSINLNLAVGAIWKEEVTLNITGLASGTIKHTNEGKILAKSASESINGKTYKDVIKAETKKTVRNSISGYTLTIIYETWLSKGVGIIYEKSTYDANEVERFGLVSYTLK
ncbi:hypothetical protein GQF61_07430 [Sphingobacterium sp. DK4209]|uniref:Uncharacterized protein n=1 Tax=Sphingobacterium zhuxiongii TaxID=2662364 RepID=A0A5Q0QF12_9SPHI|nr:MULTISPECIES: hypothetical protein [unclassified Sphingobacterium]MVZ65685.1 hypothetical protein [Sphingobacterium sp. DK4209]QGA27884.1 hypothetical protein GFH32_16820 [Sphingobacterium sp. dk4302]